MDGKVKSSEVVKWLGYVLLVIVAIVAWSLSARHLHAWAMKDLKETDGPAWLVPATFDLAPLGISLVVYRARSQGRSAFVWRLFIVFFTGISSWINWSFASGDGVGTRIISALLPIAAVVLFEALMWQVHREALDEMYEGQQTPRVPLVAWLLDRERAFAVTKAIALQPLDAAEETLRQIQEANAVTRRPVRRVKAERLDTPSDVPGIEAPKKVRKSSARDRVLDYKIENPDASQTEIATALQISAATVSRALSGARAAVDPA